MKKTLLTPSGVLFALCTSNIAASLICGVTNLLYSLGVEGEFAVSRSHVLIASAAAILIYLASAVLVSLFGDRSQCAFGVAFWGVTLCGFAFYAAFNIFGVTLAVPMLNMTAFLRLMMTLFTLPILAYNAVISSFTETAAAFIAALFVPATAFALYMYGYVKAVRHNKHNRKDV